MKIRDRIKELRRVPASQLRPNAKNWRTHPQAQRDVLQGVLAEVGYAGALIARELDDGTLELIDGHLRAETTPDACVPVLVLDVTAAEAAKLLALMDPLAALAETDRERWTSLVGEIETESAAVRELLDRLSRESAAQQLPCADENDQHDAIADLYQVTVECRSEQEQQALYERLRSEGYECRLLIL
jgi:hypothetical protein